MKRQLALELAGNLLVPMFTEGTITAFRVVSDGLPKDAKYVRTRYDGWRDKIQIIIETEDERFPPTAEGCETPAVWPAITKL